MTTERRHRPDGQPRFPCHVASVTGIVDVTAVPAAAGPRSGPQGLPALQCVGSAHRFLTDRRSEECAKW